MPSQASTLQSDGTSVLSSRPIGLKQQIAEDPSIEQ